jgi:hypothetical protein
VPWPNEATSAFIDGPKKTGCRFFLLWPGDERMPHETGHCLRHHAAVVQHVSVDGSGAMAAARIATIKRGENQHASIEASEKMHQKKTHQINQLNLHRVQT